MNVKNLLKELRAASISDNAVDFGILVIILVVVANIVQTMRSSVGNQCVDAKTGAGAWYNSSADQCVNSTGGVGGNGGVGFTATYNTSNAGLQGVVQFSNWLVIIAIVVVAGYLIYMVRGGAIQGAEYGGGGSSSGLVAYRGGAL